MLDHSSDNNVKRYPPPQQRSRVINRRTSGERFERTHSHGNDGERFQGAARNVPLADRNESGASNLYIANHHSRLISLEGCGSSEAAQLLNHRWDSAMHAFNDPKIDLADRPVMYSGSSSSAWGHSRLTQQIDFLGELQRQLPNVTKSTKGSDKPSSTN